MSAMASQITIVSTACSTVCLGVDQTSKKISKLRVTGLCEGNPPMSGGFRSQRPVTRKIFPFAKSQQNKTRTSHMHTSYDAL